MQRAQSQKGRITPFWFCVSALCVTGIGLGLVLFVRAGVSAAPVPAELVYNFGIADASHSVHHVFEVQNTLLVPLVVDSVASSCGCTAGHPPQIIAPHTKVRIPVDVHLPDNDQKFESAVVIGFRENPPLKLIMRGDVRRRYPSLIDFGTVRRGERVHRQFRFRSDGTKSCQLSDLKFDHNLFEIKTRRDRENPSDILFEIDLLRTSEVADIASNIVVRMDNANGALITIACRGHVLQPVEIARRTVAVGIVGPGRSGSADIDIAAPYGDVLDISSATSSDHGVMRCDPAQAKKTEHGLILPVMVGANFSGEVFHGVLHLTISVDGKAYKRSIDVYAMKPPPTKDAASAQTSASNAPR